MDCFWMVIRASGRGSEQTQKRHAGLKEAKEEAERLTRECKVDFVILQAVEVCLTPKAPVEWETI